MRAALRNDPIDVKCENRSFEYLPDTARLGFNAEGDCACAGISVIAEIRGSAKFPTEFR